MSKPNVVYVHSHDTGRYVQPYGYAVSTPNIQRLAEEGVVFRRAFCAGPTCSPSRAALLTGQFPHACGMTGLVNLGFGLSDYSRHIVHTLRKHGYHCALSGVQHVAKPPEKIGYDTILTAKPAEAVEAASRFLADPPSRPFFLSVGFRETHRQFPPPGPKDDPRYTRPPAVLPDTPETRADMAGYNTLARLLDENVGAVLDAIDAHDLARDTLVISTTDHGIAFPHMKCNLTDHGIGVMLIMRGPGGFDGGRVCEGMVSHVDVFPTLCDLLEIEPPEWLQGTSFLPMVRGETGTVNDAIFAEINYHDAYDPQRCVRTDRYKYIRRFSDWSRPVLPNCDNSPSKDLWVQNDWPQRHVASEELYDLMFDPMERNNLAGDPSMRAVLRKLRERLEQHMQHTDDPLLHGPIPAPPDALVSEPDAISEMNAERAKEVRRRRGKT